MLTGAALGFRAHSGWAAVVALAGLAGSPAVVERTRIELADPKNPHARQPYHAAAELELKQAEKLIAQCVKETKQMARQGLRVLIKDLKKKGYEVNGCGVLQGSGRALPALEKILASHPLLHTAEGIFFRDVLTHAGERCKLSVAAVRERELFVQGTARLRISADELQRRLTEMGKPFGPPWGQDEKFAALAAWLALAGMS
ncbi:MAG TPA: hypothetical protein VFA71_11285 [Terriglobales bacterium]|nr:hypothetical protein [Terriglobales bacterium]